MNTILFQEENNIARITFNRPQSYNSFNREMALEVQSALDQCAANHIRVVVITGTGKAFSSGQDLVEATDKENKMNFRTVLEEHYDPIVKKIRALDKPVVAAINGVAAGAGANIALACDIVVANEKASFMQAFSKIGLIPDSGGTYFLPRLVGYQKALGLAIFADRISAEEAEKMGMIYKLFSSESFEEEVEKMVQQLAQMPTKGLSFIKKAFQQSLENSLDAQLDVERKYQIAAAQTDDYQEGVQAFLEKRKANFKGQ